MNPNTEPVSLPEKDYLAILDLITRMHDCRTRREVRAGVQDHLLPLLDAQSATWGWQNMDFNLGKIVNSRVEDSVGLTSSQVVELEKANPYFYSRLKKITDTSRPVIAHDLDVSRQIFQKEIGDFFTDHPEYETDESSALHQIKTGIAISDRPDLNLLFAIHRNIHQDKPWSRRDVRVLELLQPHLIQVIKTIALSEELKKYRAFVEALAEVHTAIALVSLDHRIIFRNEAFSQLLPLQPGQRLPREVREPLERATPPHGPHFQAESFAPRIPFVQLPRGVFRLGVTLLNRDEAVESRCRLLHLKPAVEPFSKMNLLMQKHRFSAREMEVASLVCDGIDDQQISGRLFISPNTVKNHVKSIHKKLNVHTRAHLVALLNQ
ncbi:MAG: helix-turn-helix transcriptional regulator [Nitrospinaceae bacterium]